MTAFDGWNALPWSFATAVLVSLAGASPAAFAQKEFVDEEPARILTKDRDHRQEEGAPVLPPVPRDRDLVPLDSAAIGTRYDYFIDPTSVSLGGDKITRYTIVVQSDSGVRNVFYEGIRCETDEAKTYAYVSQKGQFEPLAQTSWKKILDAGAYAYRKQLLDRYVCDQRGWPLNEKQVRKRIAQNDPSGPGARTRPRIFGH